MSKKGCSYTAVNSSDYKRKRNSNEQNHDIKPFDNDTLPNEIVSIIIPVYNAEQWIEECLNSVYKSTYRPIEISAFDDSSTDSSLIKLQSFVDKFASNDIRLIVTKSPLKIPGGPGFAKNRAIEVSSGSFLCLLDADDQMREDRISMQMSIAMKNHNLIVGSNFKRIPEGSTWHYSSWANSLGQKDLILQQFRECTIIKPTWFMHRSVYQNVGGFPEMKSNVPIPEDLIFFHQHLDRDGELAKVNEELVIYRHHSGSISGKIPRRLLLRTRLEAFERRILRKSWKEFTIWGCGRDGRNFYSDLSEDLKKNVIAFCDVDPKKIKRTYHCIQTKRNIPIIHFSAAVAPIVCCVAMGRTNGELEANISSKNLVVGKDFWNFM